MTRALQTSSVDTGRAPEDGHRTNMLLLWAGQFVNTAGLMMLVPIMPFYLEQMGTRGVAATQTWAGVAIAAPALALTVATPLWGRVGDRIGRKWMVVRALGGLGVAMLVMAVASAPLVLIVGRLLQGSLGGVVEAAAAFAGSAGSDSKRGSSLGKSFSATAAGSLAGPIAGGLFVGTGGLRQLMLVIAAVAVLLGVCCAAGLREPARQAPGPDTSTARRGERPSPMSVPGAVPLAMAAVGVYFGVYGLIPVFAEQIRGIVPAPNTASLWVGVLHSVMWGATLIGSFWWGKHNDATQRPLRAFALAAGGCGASIAVLAFPLAPAAMIPLRLVQGFCFAALAQSLFLHFSRHSPDEHKSSFVSTANSFLLIGQSVGPLLAGPIVGTMPVAAAVAVMATMCGIGFLLACGPARAEKHFLDDAELDDSQTTATDGLAIPRVFDDQTVPLRPIPRSRAKEPPREGSVEVFPFRGWRVAPEPLNGLAARYATPWDQDAGHRYTSPAEATNTFRAWQRTGGLVRDSAPSLYAYEQSGPRGAQLGLLGAVHLDSSLLPHEEVVPARVEGIAEVVRTGEMNLDPLLLGYSGDGRTDGHLVEATRRAPVADVVASDGQRHRLWHITDGHAYDEIRDELGARAAFIADGHHRHTAARQVQREFVADGHAEGPWDLVSGLLVDVRRNDLRIAPIHRLLPFAEPTRALNAAAGAFRVTPLQGALDQWLRALKDHAGHGPAFVVVTGRGAFLLSEPAPRFLSGALRHWPKPLRGMHLGVLHAGLIETVWQTPDPQAHVWYEASATKAMQKVRERGGVAVLMTAPTQTDLASAAAAGIRLPFKAASFVPKPHPGLVFRAFRGD